MCAAVQDLALEALRIARGGLERRGTGEEVFLKTLQANAESGVTMADELLLKYNGEWGGEFDHGERYLAVGGTRFGAERTRVTSMLRSERTTMDSSVARQRRVARRRAERVYAACGIHVVVLRSCTAPVVAVELLTLWVCGVVFRQHR